jgi:trehalose 6-phosphate phosphatase
MIGTTPPPSDGWALFLDVDGTLLEIAPTPEAVRVPPGLPELLARLSRRFGGSLAIVSGRCIAEIDQMFHPFRFPAAGIHGIELRDARGELHYAGLRDVDLDWARAELLRFIRHHPGLILEDKGRALALHFRQVPELENEVLAVLGRVLPQLPAEAHLQPGHCVVEIKSAVADKRTAIRRLLEEPPFAGRVPVFVGDDVTDHEGLAYVESAGGHAVFVGPAPRHVKGWLPDPAAVRAWLGTLADAPGAPAEPPP